MRLLWMRFKFLLTDEASPDEVGKVEVSNTYPQSLHWSIQRSNRVH